MRIWILGGLVVLCAGCLQTREAMEDGGAERASLREQMKALQARSAQQEIRLDELMAEVRRLTGKVDTAGSPAAPRGESEVTQLKERLKVYEEELEKLNREIRSLKQGHKTSSRTAPQVPAGDLAAGDYHYDQKWLKRLS